MSRGEDMMGRKGRKPPGPIYRSSVLPDRGPPDPLIFLIGAAIRGDGVDEAGLEARGPTRIEAVLSRRSLPSLAPPGAADRHQERQRHQDPRQQRQLVDPRDRIALVAPEPDPVRAAG